MSGISLRGVIAAVLDCDPATLTEESGQNDTEGWDSLKQFLITSDVETRFGVNLTFEQIERCNKVGAIRAALLEHGVPTSP